MSEHHSSDRHWLRMFRRILAPTALLLLVAIASFSVAQQPGNIGPAPGQQVTLRQQLTVGLKAFTKADFAFIDLVVLAVEQRKLPRILVDSTFLWARQKAAQQVVHTLVTAYGLLQAGPHPAGQATRREALDLPRGVGSP